MRREPVIALDAEREAALREQLEEAWVDIERALDGAEDGGRQARARPEPPAPVVGAGACAGEAQRPPAAAVTAVIAARERLPRWPSRALAAAALLLVLTALRYLAGGH